MMKPESVASSLPPGHHHQHQQHVHPHPHPHHPSHSHPESESHSGHHDQQQNYSLTLDDIRSLLNPENYSPSYKATLTRRTVLIIAFYCTIVVISLFGNLLVCYVVFKRKRMRISTNLLMTNLALSDLLMTTINIPFNIARVLLDQWPFGSFLCIMVPLVQVTSVYVSTLTMTIIAIDRYQAIINPLHKRITTTVPTSAIILVIWTAAGLISIPNVAFNRVVLVAGHIQRCRAVYPSPEILYRRYITLFTFLTQYAIPLLITTIAYIRIGFDIWSGIHRRPDGKSNHQCNYNAVGGGGGRRQSPDDHQHQHHRNRNHNHNHNHNRQRDHRWPDSMGNSVGSQPPASSHHHHRRRHKSLTGKSSRQPCYNHQHQQHQPASISRLRERSRRKSIKMLAFVVGVFSLCWLPLNIFHLNADFSSTAYISDPNIFFVCHWFAMSSVCYNPFIYFWLNHHYRQEVQHLIRCTNCAGGTGRRSLSSTSPPKHQHRRQVLEDPDLNDNNLLNGVDRRNCASLSITAGGAATAPVTTEEPAAIVTSSAVCDKNFKVAFRATTVSTGGCDTSLVLHPNVQATKVRRWPPPQAQPP